MAQHQRLMVLVVSIASLTAACGANTPSAAPSGATSAPSAAPSGATPTSAPTPTPGAPTTSGQADATITLGDFGDADGPGISVKVAIAQSSVEPLLVNGILLKAIDGTIWLCPALAVSDPPQCAEPRLLVKNWVPSADDQTFVSGDGLHHAAGVSWIDRTQLFGVVHGQ